MSGDEVVRKEPDAFQTGSRFGRYEIVRCIGTGGMGAVFEASHELLKKRVAVKTMHANLGQSEAARSRFLREAETVARVRHPNVVDISDVGVENGTPYLVMELLEGEDLARLLERSGRLTGEQMADIVVPIAAGLWAVHRVGIVHRDVKPENVLLARDPRGELVPKVVDFGVSKNLEKAAGGMAPYTVTGTPQYMAPEQARGSSALDGRADQYALGVLCYQCLTGVLPFQSESLLELLHLVDVGQFQPLRERCPDLPPELEAVVQRAMARHLRDRYANMAAFGRALLPFASERTRQTYERDFNAPLLAVGTSSADEDPRVSAPTARPGEELTDPARTPQTWSGVRFRNHVGLDGAAPPSTRRKLAWALAGALVALALLLFFGLRAWRAPQEVALPRVAERQLAVPADVYRVQLAVAPAVASLALDDVGIGSAPVDVSLPRDGRTHVLKIEAPGYDTRFVSFRDAAPAERAIALTKSMPAGSDVPSETAPKARAPRKSAAKESASSAAPPAELDIQLSR